MSLMTTYHSCFNKRLHNHRTNSARQTQLGHVYLTSRRYLCAFFGASSPLDVHQSNKLTRVANEDPRSSAAPMSFGASAKDHYLKAAMLLGI